MPCGRSWIPFLRIKISQFGHSCRITDSIVSFMILSPVKGIRILTENHIFFIILISSAIVYRHSGRVLYDLGFLSTMCLSLHRQVYPKCIYSFQHQKCSYQYLQTCTLKFISPQCCSFPGLIIVIIFTSISTAILLYFFSIISNPTLISTFRSNISTSR